MAVVNNVDFVPLISLTIEFDRLLKQIQPRLGMVKKRLAAYRLTIVT